MNPSDMAPALMALDAQVKTSERILHIRDFFSAENGQKPTVLFDDEILMEFVIPISQYISRTSFQKFSIRKSIDFAIVNCAVYLSMELNKISYASISINAVYPNPIRAEESEKYLIGKEISESIAQQAAELSVARAKPLPMNRYKVQIAKTLVKDAIITSY